MKKLETFMYKDASVLRNFNWGYLSVFLPILILASVLILWYAFEIYIVTNIIQVVGLYKTSIPAVGIFGIVLGVLGLQNKASHEPNRVRGS